MGSPSRDRNAQLIGVIWPFLAVILILVALAMLSIDIMSSVRAYIGGESTWSKSQKDAVFYLDLYAEPGEPAAYRQYRAAVAGPQNLRRAREALERDPPDDATARSALLAGGIYPADIDDMIWAVRMFRRVSYFDEALGHWTRADARLEQLDTVAHALHAQLKDGARDAAIVDPLKQQIRQINADIAPDSLGFSVVLGTAFRRTASLLLAADLIATLTLVLLCAVHVRRLIGERGRIEAALTQSEARAKATLGSIGEAVIATGPTGIVEFVNPAAERIAGVRAADCLGRPLVESFLLLHEASREPVDPLAQAHFGRHAEWVLRCPDGDEIFVQAVSSRISDSAVGRPGAAAAGSSEMGFVLILRNMTREHEYIESLAWAATHDALTGLVNRAEFEARLAGALADGAQEEQRASALLFLDLDRFKAVNDTCGHAAGDAMLREVAARFERAINRADTLARLGGDEFAVLLAGSDPARTEAVAERLRASLNDFAFNWEAQLLTTSVSVGVVDLCGARMSVEEALRLADISCYMAKERGRDRVQMADLRDRELVRHANEVSWGRRLKKALEHEHFCLYIQPIVAVGEGRIQEPRRAELLLRMQEPGAGVIAPNLFVPAAERYGLMTLIDRWVVRTALDVLANAERKHFDEYSINLSGASVGDERFLGFVREQFASSGVAPSLICFEITETAAIANLASAARFMRELNALGCRFALDDFGAGMSSFGYLKHLPVEYLKIDGSFVMDIQHDSVSRDMVAAINEMGHSMKCRTIAEYVESDGILRTLGEIGVDYAQGFHIGRPLPWMEEAVAPVAASA
ncbi:sensory box protein [Caballeronia arationis]|uniref:putative bifunctional diguanylate cyclase/phosphodiesterase n=1 Tax=Caballeronia arationis TaxID=1777142 RepID=UPI00074CEE88|nr:EAL domain-containing protein [Caballeronia arationis]SAK85040.1 sensory box protein [Caballeronia arationis]